MLLKLNKLTCESQCTLLFWKVMLLQNLKVQQMSDAWVQVRPIGNYYKVWSNELKLFLKQSSLKEWEVFVNHAKV